MEPLALVCLTLVIVALSLPLTTYVLARQARGVVEQLLVHLERTQQVGWQPGQPAHLIVGEREDAADRRREAEAARRARVANDFEHGESRILG